MNDHEKRSESQVVILFIEVDFGVCIEPYEASVLHFLRSLSDLRLPLKGVRVDRPVFPELFLVDLIEVSRLALRTFNDFQRFLVVVVDDFLDRITFSLNIFRNIPGVAYLVGFFGIAGVDQINEQFDESISHKVDQFPGK